MAPIVVKGQGDNAETWTLKQEHQRRLRVFGGAEENLWRHQKGPDEEY